MQILICKPEVSEPFKKIRTNTNNIIQKSMNPNNIIQKSTNPNNIIQKNTKTNNIIQKSTNTNNIIQKNANTNNSARGVLLAKFNSDFVSFFLI